MTAEPAKKDAKQYEIDRAHMQAVEFIEALRGERLRDWEKSELRYMIEKDIRCH